MVTFAFSLIVASASSAFPQTATVSSTPTRGDPWPRDASVAAAKIPIYQPQLESWNGNLLDAYSAVTIKTPENKETNYRVIWFAARRDVDKINRVVNRSS